MSPVYKYGKNITFDGIETVKVVDVSAEMLDARDGLWTLYDIGGEPIEGAVQPSSMTEVTLTVSPAPIAGTYRLVGLA